MQITYRQWRKIKFPVFILPSDDWYTNGKILFWGDGRVLDDRSVPGRTLGVRRAQCGRHDLYPIKKALLDFPSLLKSKKSCFIDSKGMPFTYKKTARGSLKSHRIKHVELKDTASLLWVKDIPHPFTVPRPPDPDYLWVQLLYIGSTPWVVYSYSIAEQKATNRGI